MPGDAGSLSGTASVSIGQISRAIDGVFVDDDGIGNDDFTISVSGADNFGFVAGDVVSWSGSLEVTGIDLNDLVIGAYSSSNFSSEADSLDLNLNISSSTAAVPAPASIVLLSLGLVFLGRRRRNL